MTPKPTGLLLALALLAPAALLTPVAARAQQGYDQDEVYACEADAFRLCLSSIPNEAQVETCFRAHMSELSPGCRHKLEPTPAVPAHGRKRR